MHIVKGKILLLRAFPASQPLTVCKMCMLAYMILAPDQQDASSSSQHWCASNARCQPSQLTRFWPEQLPMPLLPALTPDGGGPRLNTMGA